MKTQSTLIPFALLLVFLFTCFKSEAKELPGKRHLPQMNEQSEILDLNPCLINSSGILTPKYYQYVSSTMLEKKEIITFLFDDDTKASIFVDEDGNYYQNIVRLRNTEVKKEKIGNKSYLESFRKHSGSLFRTAISNVFQNDVSREAEILQNDSNEIKYFKSDYDDYNRIYQ
ncbi:MAG: hypothetical protein ACOC01_00585 [Bacteroidales bacterium]